MPRVKYYNDLIVCLVHQILSFPSIYPYSMDLIQDRLAEKYVMIHDRKPVCALNYSITFDKPEHPQRGLGN